MTKMKKLFLLIAIFNTYFPLLSQKHDFNWMFGYDSYNPNDTTYGISILNFDTPDGNPITFYDGYKKIH